MQTKILVIDDEEPLCEILRFNLTKEGYDVDCAFSAEEALAMDLTPYQLFIVDIMMDKLTGFDFARKIKNNPVLENKPIIFCSALNGEDETVMGLNIGADDYITKPFQIQPVIARVRAVLRRAGNHSAAHHHLNPVIAPHQSVQLVNSQEIAQRHEPDIVFKTLRINQDEKTCYLNGQPIKLTKTEFDMLLFFLTHKSKIYSRDEIRKNVWGDDVVVTSRAIDTNITRLRKKIENYGAHIVTRTGFGYGFQEEL